MGGNTANTQREEKLKALASAYDGFIELKSNLEEGTKVDYIRLKDSIVENKHNFF